jgi:hypothetical protein
MSVNPSVQVCSKLEVWSCSCIELLPIFQWLFFCEKTKLCNSRTHQWHYFIKLDIPLYSGLVLNTNGSDGWLQPYSFLASTLTCTKISNLIVLLTVGDKGTNCYIYLCNRELRFASVLPTGC